jgi:site-specific DNA-methyltransferase (adenine-specific)
MVSKVLFSSNTEDWETPSDFFKTLDEEFHFTLDPCATPSNAKVERYYTKEDNGLAKDWGGEVVFCNPPYGKKIVEWVKKSRDEGKKPGTTVVMLIPARTDTTYFHDYIYGQAEIRFIRGRLRFGGSKNAAPFPSMLVIYKSQNK